MDYLAFPESSSWREPVERLDGQLRRRPACRHAESPSPGGRKFSGGARSGGWPARPGAGRYARRVPASRQDRLDQARLLANQLRHVFQKSLTRSAHRSRVSGIAAKTAEPDYGAPRPTFRSDKIWSSVDPRARFILDRPVQLVDALVVGVLVAFWFAAGVLAFVADDAGAGAGAIMETCEPSPNVIVLVLDPSALVMDVIVGAADDAVAPLGLVDWVFEELLAGPFVLLVPPTEFSKSD
jgi:hypothetical protein